LESDDCGRRGCAGCEQSFTVNAEDTLAVMTTTHYLGFQVSDVATGRATVARIGALVDSRYNIEIDWAGTQSATRPRAARFSSSFGAAATSSC
jgi:hypothetical protein